MRSVSVDRIIVSPFETQIRRRSKFNTEDIETLSDSILRNGLRQPIQLRPVGDKLEIVFGESRFLAHLAKNLSKINCFVDELSDVQVVELQWAENHDRQEPDPLDDTFTFAYLKSEQNLTDYDLSIKYKMSETNVARRLKLNDLIPEAKDLLSRKILPLGHAVFMATLGTEAQKEIVEDRMYYLYSDHDQRILTYDEFEDLIGVEITRELSNAPFDTSDPRLHIKNLTCADCPQRTGFEPKLFDEGFAKGDKCLNKKCFEMKTNVNLKIQQAEIAEANVATMGEAVELSNQITLKGPGSV